MRLECTAENAAAPQHLLQDIAVEFGGRPERVPGDVRAVVHLERPFLHAARLVFTHPADGRRMEFESPLPADLQGVLDDLRTRTP